MAKTIGGVRENKNNKEDVTLSMIGLTPTQIQQYGGIKELGGVIEYYNEQVKKTVDIYSFQATTGTPQQFARLVSHLNEHKSYGTNESFFKEIREMVNDYERGEYTRRILRLDSEFMKNMVDSHVRGRATRVVLTRLKKI